jgi:hypothetical protein
MPSTFFNVGWWVLMGSGTASQGPAIDVTSSDNFYNFSGVCCQTHRHHPPGALHRRLH